MTNHELFSPMWISQPTEALTVSKPPTSKLPMGACGDEPTENWEGCRFNDYPLESINK